MGSNVVIIGAGHNGLAAAYYLARAGLKPIVLERQADVGGGAITTEIHPGFRCPTLTHDVHLHAGIAADMELTRHGLEWLTPQAQVFAVDGDTALVIHADVARTAEGLGRHSVKDAAAYPEFRTALDAAVSVVADAFTRTPPDIDAPGARDLWDLLKLGRRFRAIGRRNGYRLLRWGPMPVADFVSEWFDTELLRSALAARGLSGTMLGPRSAGSTLVLLMREAHRQLAAGTSRVRGGPGALTRAMASAARGAGAEIRTGTRVAHIVVRDGVVTAVRTEAGEIAARAVLSTADPATTFLGLCDPLDLSPDFALKMRNYRAKGTVAKVNLALAALPRFSGGDAAALSGRIHIGGTLDTLERAFDHAKYGEYSAEPWLDITIPSILDPALAPAGAHVASIYVHYAPYRLRGEGWDDARDGVLAATMRVLERHAPGISGQIVAAQVITPLDLERVYGFAGGHIFHGELALDQLFTMRPLLGFGRYRAPVTGLYLGGAGTHPGGFLTGASGRLAAAAVVADLKRRI